MVEDICCDSNYMLDIMPKVGKAIQDAYLKLQSFVDKLKLIAYSLWFRSDSI